MRPRARLFGIALALLAVWAAVPASAQPPRPLVLVLGDSVTAGYGLPAERAFPAVLQGLLAGAGHPSEVVNAGLSGDTTAGGLARLPDLYPPQASRAPDLLIVELGANDAIQRLALERVEANLDSVLVFARKRGSRILLTGIGAGIKRTDAYRTAFEGIYRRLAEKHGVAYYPRIGDGVRGDPRYVQADGAHPNAEGARIIADRLLPFVLRLLQDEQPVR
ncbi:MAG: arylesterase [Humidesulfovibrio sp.]|uniref:arylesterase n=1 Tax=Humidesulfovibrio sp. TaxID=2910988 RepID=UPI0027369F37|nr:arylesterase [Humidesulfovibrio sp.]MDP2847177.1 arylesterase [Humidesulfovibrio sp.]MDQ7834844.1 arylesterase [Humidesulfovibrio sp.]